MAGQGASASARRHDRPRGLRHQPRRPRGLAKARRHPRRGLRAAIEDLGSTNGTFVNDQRIEGLRPLNEGDTVRFGNTVWRLQVAAGATRAVNVQAAPATPAGGEEPTSVQPAGGPPQVTAAAAPQPAATPPAPPPPPAPSAQPGGEGDVQSVTPERVAASVGAPDQRGDVPKPPDYTPSAIRRVLPPPPQGQAVPFSAGETPRCAARRPRGSARRSSPSSSRRWRRRAWCCSSSCTSPRPLARSARAWPQASPAWRVEQQRQQ